MARAGRTPHISPVGGWRGNQIRHHQPQQPIVRESRAGPGASLRKDHGRSPSSEPGESAVKVINHLGDEAMKVFSGVMIGVQSRLRSRCHA